MTTDRERLALGKEQLAMKEEVSQRRKGVVAVKEREFKNNHIIPSE